VKIGKDLQGCRSLFPRPGTTGTRIRNRPEIPEKQQKFVVPETKIPARNNGNKNGLKAAGPAYSPSSDRAPNKRVRPRSEQEELAAYFGVEGGLTRAEALRPSKYVE
jgi:hypothetical protein